MDKEYIIQKETLKKLSDSVRILKTDTLERTPEEMTDAIKTSALDMEFRYSASGESKIILFGSGVHKFYKKISEQSEYIYVQDIDLNENGTESISMLEEMDDMYLCFAIDSLKNIDTIIFKNVKAEGAKISELKFNQDNEINKIVAYDNNLTELDLSHCKELQYLHIHNNPICFNKNYLDNLISAMKSLPNRSNKSCGSITFSPWYGLPILLQVLPKDIDLSDKLWAYKININNTTRYIAKYPCEIIEENKYNRDIFQDGFALDIEKSYWLVNPTTGELSNPIKFKQIEYNNRIIEEYEIETSKNYLRLLRLALETSGTVINKDGNSQEINDVELLTKKNWMFGSAIQYTDEWNKLPHYFRELHVVDFWESAEYGFGAKIGMCDMFESKSKTHAKYPTSLWKNWNIQLNSKNNSYFNFDEDSTGYDKAHGLYLSVLLCGRGEGSSSYGLAPQAIYLPMHGYSATFKASEFKEEFLSFLQNNANCCTLSWEGISEDEPLSNDIDWENFCINNFVCNSIGNRGLGSPYYVSKPGHYDAYGDKVFYVTSLDTDTSYSGYSTAAMKDYADEIIAMYGTTYVGFPDQKAYKGLGTSMATPLATSYLCLLRNVYKKLNPNYEGKYGKNSDFMKYVKKYWTRQPKDSLYSFSSFGALNILGNSKPYNTQEIITNSWTCNFTPSNIELTKHDIGSATIITKYKTVESIAEIENPSSNQIVYCKTDEKVYQYNSSLLTWQEIDPIENHIKIANETATKTEYRIRYITNSNDSKYIIHNSMKPQEIITTDSSHSKIIYNKYSYTFDDFKCWCGTTQLKLQLVNLQEDGNCYPLWGEENMNIAYIPYGGSSRHTYSSLFLMDNDGDLDDSFGLKAWEPIAFLHTLNYNPEEEIELTVKLINDNQLDFYWNGQKIKTWYSDFGETISFTEPINSEDE